MNEHPLDISQGNGMGDIQPVAAAGDLLDGRYFVFERIEGGQGYVYLCYDAADGRFWALKTVRQNSFDQVNFQMRFLREIELWIQLPLHDSVVRCEDARLIGETPFAIVHWVMPMQLQGELGETILRTLLAPAMLEHEDGWDPKNVLSKAWQPRRLHALKLCREELLARYGRHRRQRITLEDWLLPDSTGPRVDAPVAVGWIVDICQALVDCRAAQPNLAHCDIHARNVLIAEWQRAMLTDFGIANIVNPPSPSYREAAKKDVRDICQLLECVAVSSDYGRFGFEVAERMIDRAHQLSSQCQASDGLQTPEQLLEAVRHVYADVFGKAPPVSRRYDFTGFDHAMIGKVFAYMLGNPYQARARYDQAIAADSGNFLANYLLGLQALETRQPERAIVWFDQAYLWMSDTHWRNGYGAQLQTLRGYTLALLGLVADALQAFERALEIDASHIEARLCHAALLADAGELPSAIEQTRDILKRMQSHPDAHSDEMAQAASSLLERLTRTPASQAYLEARPRMVIVLPDLIPSDTPLYCISAPIENLFEVSLAKEDGSFTEPSRRWQLPDEYVLFPSPDDAIAWAESPPRFWQVVNKYEVMSNPPRLPRRVTVRIEKATHDTLRSSMFGQAICRIRFRPLMYEPVDHPLPEDIRSATFILDEATQARFERIGWTRFSHLAGQVVTLQIEDERDYSKPWRLHHIALETSLDSPTTVTRVEHLIAAQQFDAAERELDQRLDLVDGSAIVAQFGITTTAAPYIMIAHAALKHATHEPANDQQALLQLAERCLEKGWRLFDIPIDCPQHALEQTPLLHRSLFYLGAVKWRLSKHAECLRCWRALIQLPPMDAESARWQQEVMAHLAYADAGGDQIGEAS